MTQSKFIVVKHDAKKARLHYDLRFVMPKSKIWASFAVRKGLPTQPGTKVLAVRTHDHTDKEALFIGTIKDGYGAGKLTKWDDGQCIIHKYTPSHIILELKGRRFKGIYHMISTGVMNKKDFKKRSFMLFKSKKTVVESYLRELGTVGRVIVGMGTGVPLAGQGRRITPVRCKQLYPNNPARYQACIDSAKPATESYLAYLDEIMGMRSLVPRRGIVDDVEKSEDELQGQRLPWSKKIRAIAKEQMAVRSPNARDQDQDQEDEQKG